MKKLNLKDIATTHGSTNWKKLRNQTDSEIEKNAKKSNDAKLLKPLELAELRLTKNS